MRLTRQTWLVEYNGTLKRVTDNYPAIKHRDRLNRMRYVICKATKLNADKFRFVGNKRTHGKWYTEWMVV